MSEASRLDDGADYLGREFDDASDECINCAKYIRYECEGELFPCKEWREYK